MVTKLMKLSSVKKHKKKNGQPLYIDEIKENE